MKHPADDEALPPGTVVRANDGVFWLIKAPVFVHNGKGFLHYHAHKEGEDYAENSFHALYAADIAEVEAWPPGFKKSGT
jgi:hypothetical protein